MKKLISYNTGRKNLKFRKIIYSICIMLLFTANFYGKYIYGCQFGKYIENLSKTNKNEEQKESSNTEDLQILAKSAVLVDGNTGRVLFGKDEDKKMPMASTTKIMTCIVALEKCKENKVMTVSDRAVRMPKVHMNVKKGEQYYFKDLLYAMMLESYNDVAVVVAENIGGSVEGFAKMMNDKAKEIGANNTNFVTPNGLDDAKHFSTAKDMALIGAYAIKNKEFRNIVNTKSYSFNDVTGRRSVSVTNKDAYITMDKEALGIKTGFTGNAGYCFVGALKSGERLFTSCVLACGWPPNKSYKWKDTRVLMNYAKSKFNYKTVLEENKEFFVNIQNGTKNKIRVKIIGGEEVVMKDDEQISTKTTFNYKLPIHIKDRIGETQIYINNQQISSHKIIAMEAVQKYDYLYCLKKTFYSFVLQ